MESFVRRGLACLATLLAVFFLGSAGSASAAGPCADDGGSFPANCTKEIRIWNNTPGTIYVVLQGSIQLTDARNCTVAAKGGGDVWLQAALGSIANCLAVKNDYYVYINPLTGVAPGRFVSVSLPWWSKRQVGAPDTYIDWWRGGRFMIFDDKAALNDSFAKLTGTPTVQFAAGSPLVSCKTVANNACLPAQLRIYQVTPAAAIASYTPFQLNEFTFADVSAVTNNGTQGGVFLDFNQNYNVSNVDQTYLPIAIEPVRLPADVGYMGTIMSVPAFRARLAGFTGADDNPTNPGLWPIYNNPGNRYPNAGIRVPSTETVFNFYMSPSTFPSGQPEIIPATPPARIRQLMGQWRTCLLANPVGCPQSDIYKEIDAAFAASYAVYLTNCTPPPAFAPQSGTNPPAPTLFAYLRNVYGWVPFNTAAANTSCTVPDLPTANQPPAGSRAPIDYINLQYNYQVPGLPKQDWFNLYTRLVHFTVGASAYAFSIDDHASFQSNDGGSLPGGLIVAVGGPNGLPNQNQVPPPVPPYYPYFGFAIGLGAPSAGNAFWKAYGICSGTADIPFPGGPRDGYTLGVDPAVENIRSGNTCPITLLDSKNRRYMVVVRKAAVPPAPIWPAFTPSAGSNFDPTVLSCPTIAGFVPPAQWCNFTNELANPVPSPRIYSIGTRAPLP